MIIGGVNVNIQRDSGRVRIQFQQSLTVANLQELKRRLPLDTAQEADRVILDFSQVQDMDCAGARQVLYFLDDLQQEKKEVEITNLDSPYVKKFFDISGLKEELKEREKINISDELQPF